jgi:ABC-type multidrug transport system ATPase subunit
MSLPVVEVRNLSKWFPRRSGWRRWRRAPRLGAEGFYALRDVSLAVAPGEILGVAGPNGAGKTTLLRLIADLLEAETGSVRLGGRELAALGHLARRSIGYVSNDERSFFWRLTGRQNLEFFGRLYGLSRGQVRRRIDDLLEGFDLHEQARRLFRDYSSGTRKKLAVVRALLHEPPLVLLDEATNSLDPPSARRVKSLVRDYVSGGPPRAALWSTHRLEEIGEICDNVLVINQGCVEFLGPAREPRAVRMLCT